MSFDCCFHFEFCFKNEAYMFDCWFHFMSTSVDVAHGPQTTVAWCDEEYFSGRVFWSLAQKLSTTLQLCVTFPFSLWWLKMWWQILECPTVEDWVSSCRFGLLVQCWVLYVWIILFKFTCFLVIWVFIRMTFQGLFPVSFCNL